MLSTSLSETVRSRSVVVTEAASGDALISPENLTFSPPSALSLAGSFFGTIDTSPLIRSLVICSWLVF